MHQDRKPKEAQAAKIDRRIKHLDRAARVTIKAHRDNAGKTQIELAEYMGWTEDQQQNAESGKRGLRVSEFIVQAEGMGEDPRVLFESLLDWELTHRPSSKPKGK